MTTERQGSCCSPCRRRRSFEGDSLIGSPPPRSTDRRADHHGRATVPSPGSARNHRCHIWLSLPAREHVDPRGLPRDDSCDPRATRHRGRPNPTSRCRTTGATTGCRCRARRRRGGPRPSVARRRRSAVSPPPSDLPAPTSPLAKKLCTRSLPVPRANTSIRPRPATRRPARQRPGPPIEVPAPTSRRRTTCARRRCRAPFTKIVDAWPCVQTRPRAPRLHVPPRLSPPLPSSASSKLSCSQRVVGTPPNTSSRFGSHETAAGHSGEAPRAAPRRTSRSPTTLCRAGCRPPGRTCRCGPATTMPPFVPSSGCPTALPPVPGRRRCGRLDRGR